MAQQSRSRPQTKEAMIKSYQQRLRDDVKSMIDNYTEIIKLAKEEGQTHVSRSLQIEQDQFEMQVRAANMVRSGESLLKLVSDLKQSLILNDFVSVNEAILQNTNLFKGMQNDCDSKLLALRDDMAAELYELEEEYYSSPHK